MSSLMPCVIAAAHPHCFGEGLQTAFMITLVSVGLLKGESGAFGTLGADPRGSFGMSSCIVN